MKFLDIFKGKKTAEKHYIGLFLKHDALEAFLYQISGTILTTIAHQTRPYSNGWDNLTEDADEVLFGIEQETKKSFEDAILFLHSNLINAASREIDDPYKQHIKKLLKQLELKPLGFIECYEAVVTYLEKRDHTLLNAVLVELSGDQVGVYVYTGGRQVFRSNRLKTSNLVDHLSDEFSNLKQDIMLPSRIILFGEHDYKSEIDDVSSHHFQGKQFIHMPRVEYFSDEELRRAFAETFKDQIVEEPDLKIPDKPGQNFEVMESSRTESPQKEVMGFVIGDDIEDMTHNEEKSTTQEVALPTQSAKNVSKKNSPAEILQIIRKKGLASLTFMKHVFPSKQKKIPYIVGAAFLVIVLAAGSIEYFFHKAEIVVYFPSQNIEKNLSVPAVLGENDIDLKVGTVSAQVSNKKVTTGKHEVGDKAKGEVNIYNFSDADHLFPKGTTLTAEGKSFLLDKDVKVASASIVFISGPVQQPGKAAGQIIAKDIGPEYNLDKGKKFQIEDQSLSNYFAMNDDALKGGSKKEVNTVAKSDEDQLRKLALNTGSQQAKDDFIKMHNNKDEQVLGALTEALPKKLDFTKDVGDEANEVALKADIGVTYYTYSAQKMKEFVKKALDSNVQDGFVLPKEKVLYTVKDASNKADTVTLEIEATGKAMHKYSQEEILKKVAGKNQKDLESIIKNDLKASGFEIKTNSAPLFFLADHLPLAKGNISIKVDSL